jgi:hypothetical protein
MLSILLVLLWSERELDILLEKDDALIFGILLWISFLNEKVEVISPRKKAMLNTIMMSIFKKRIPGMVWIIIHI